jgi:hypothetical protein
MRTKARRVVGTKLRGVAALLMMAVIPCSFVPVVVDGCNNLDGTVAS